MSLAERYRSRAEAALPWFDMVDHDEMTGCSAWDDWWPLDDFGWGVGVDRLLMFEVDAAYTRGWFAGRASMAKGRRPKPLPVGGATG